MLEEIVEIAREFDLFLIADEIYTHIVYNGNEPLHLSEVIGDVCGHRHARHLQGIALAGLALRLDRGAQPRPRREVRTYVDSLLAAKRLEVCSHDAPQMAIPRVMGDPRYPGHLRSARSMFEARADEAVAAVCRLRQRRRQQARRARST